MKKYFKIQLEFDHDKLEKKIRKYSQKKKGYCCFVDSNLLVESHKSQNNRVRKVLNHSLINSCDGSYIALLASFIHKKKLRAYNGPAFFSKFIYQPGSHCIIGNTRSVYEKIRTKVLANNKNSTLSFIPTPFLEVDQFDYKLIAKKINQLKPRYIWVSMGAPKQEIFMWNLQPYLKKGIMLGVGAALNYFSGEIKEIPAWATRYNLIWFYRLLTEPRKQLKRILKIVESIPKILLLETRNV